MNFKHFLPALLIFITASAAQAEHRVALLIGISDYQNPDLAIPATDLQALAAGLEQYGVRARVVEDAKSDKLKSQLDAFTSGTPTRGTALVFFAGQVLPGSYNGRDVPCLVAADAKSGDPREIGRAGYRLELLLERLNASGGASVHLVIVDSADDGAEFDVALPAGCLLARADSKTLVGKWTGRGDLVAATRAASGWSNSSLAAGVAVAGRGSPVVAPPDTFLEGTRAGDEWVNSRGMVFCWCPPGSYTAGSPDDEPGRYPDEAQRQVTIDHGFWISKYELTLRENMRNHPRNTIASHKNDPLTMINLDDAKSMTSLTFTDQQRKQGCLPRDWEYSLPTEEQWEYAARAGSTASFYFGDDLRQLPQHANFADKSFYDSQDIYSNAAHRTLDDGAVNLALVGSYLPNPWGLHDVYGNVAEWCISTAIRGGSWASVPENCRSAYRDSFSSRNEQNFIGYRLVIQKVLPAK